MRHSTRLWQGLSQDPQIPGTLVSSPSNCRFFIQVPDWQVRGQVGPSFHPVQTQTDLQQVQNPKVIRRSMAPVPRAQKANTHPTQCQDTTTTIKQQSRPVGGALRFHCQEWQKLTDNPMDNTVHTRLPPRADRDPTRELPCALSSEATRAEQSPRERGSGSPSKGCNRANNKIRFLQPNVCSPKERRGVVPHYQPQEVQCVPLSLSLQDGEYQQCEGCYPGERLHGKDRSERCLPDGSSLGEAPQISQVCVGRPVLPVQVPTLWASHSTQNLHKTPTASSCRDEEKGSLLGHVPRRYPCDGTDQGGTEGTSESNCISPPVTRIHPEQAEVCLGANPQNRIPGVYCGLRDSDDLSSKGQDIQTSERVQEHEQQGQSNRSPTGTDNRLAIVSDTSNSTSTPALSSPSETEMPGSTAVSRGLRVHYPSQHRGAERFELVDTRCTSLQWLPHSCTDSRPSDNLGCLQNRLGSDMPRGSTPEIRGEHRKEQNTSIFWNSKQLS